MYKKTIVGVGQVDMTPEEIAERQAEELAWEAQKNQLPKPSAIEIRIAAIEEKIGMQDQDKITAEKNLKGEK